MESGTATSNIAGVFEGSCRTNVLQFINGSNRAGRDREVDASCCHTGHSGTGYSSGVV